MRNAKIKRQTPKPTMRDTMMEQNRVMAEQPVNEVRFQFYSSYGNPIDLRV
jgi:hypothetical protein